MKAWKIGAAMAVAAATAAAGAVATLKDAKPAAAAAPPAPEVSVAEVLVRDVAGSDEFTGRIEAVETVDVRPRVGGYIEQVNFAEGGEVRKGDVLFVIDQRPYRAELDRAKAELARARAAAALTRSQADRAQKMIDGHLISREDYDQRLAAASQAEASVQAAQAALETARLNLEFSEVRSPIDGRVGRAIVTAGNLVSGAPSATLLTTVVSIDPVYAYFQGDEQTFLRYARLARAGELPGSVLVGLADEQGYPHEGVMDFVDNQLDPATGTIRGRAILPNKDRVFTPGLFARIKLVGSDKHPAMLIDDKAVLTDQDRKYVYVLGADNKAERRDVRLGRIVDGLRVVEQGLAQGDRVIVNGVQKVFFPGMQVKPLTVAMSDRPEWREAPYRGVQTAAVRSAR